MWPIFKTKMLIYQSKANLDEKIFFLVHDLYGFEVYIGILKWKSNFNSM